MYFWYQALAMMIKNCPVSGQPRTSNCLSWAGSEALQRAQNHLLNAALLYLTLEIESGIQLTMRHSTVPPSTIDNKIKKIKQKKSR